MNLAHASLPKPKAILFDFDDTLIDTWPFLWRLYQDTFAQFNIVLTDLLTETACRDKAVRDGRKTFEDVLGTTLGPKACEIFLTTYAKTFPNHITPLPGASHALQSLSQQNIPLGIVSNKHSTFLNQELKILGWE